MIDDLLRLEFALFAMAVLGLALNAAVAVLAEPRNESKRGRHR